MSFAIVSEAQLQLLRSKYASAFSEDISSKLEVVDSLSPILQQLLSNPGGLVRAQLCVATLSPNGAADSDRGVILGLAVEYYHLASLLFDDLPCMDNAETRRGNVAAHLSYGEANTILSALALINKAYSLLWSAIAELPAVRRQSCSDLIQRCLGESGVIGGQALDLGFASLSQVTRRLVTKIADQKTGTLFSLSMLLPAMLAVEDENELRQVKILARYFGRLYQLIDDYKDLANADIAASKSHRDAQLHRPNMVLLLGEDKAQAYLSILISILQRAINRLVCSSSRWRFYQILLDVLSETAQKLLVK